MSNADNSFLDDIAAKTIQKIEKNKTISDPITFAEASWGLGYSFLPAQKFITKCIYRMPLDNTEKYIPLKDQFAQKLIDTFTEVQFLQYLIKEKRTNIVSLDWYNQRIGKQRYNQVILCAGRRASKCFDQDFQIITDHGIITCKQLLDLYKKGQIVGINTFDKNDGKIKITKNIKVQQNGQKYCVKIITNNGYFNTVTLNHPVLVWRDDYLQPKFINAEQLKVGDLIACSKLLNYENDKQTIGIGKSKILGYLYGDGSISTSYVGFTNADEAVIKDLSNCIEQQFPRCCLFKRPTKYYYAIVKKNKKDVDKKNDVKQWLKQLNCFGVKAKDKRIPDIIKKATKKQIASFLNALFACDGYVNIKKARKDRKVVRAKISICLASKQFIYDIQNILLTFGILTNIRYSSQKYNGKQFDSWVLQTKTFYDSIKFVNEIGILGKQEKTNKLLQFNKQSDAKFLTPHGIWNRINLYKQKNNVSYCKIYGTKNRTDSNRLRMYNKISQKKALRCAKNMNDDVIKNYCCSDIYWAQLSQVQFVGKKNTIAIQVMQTNVIATSIITHNSNLSSVIANYQVYRLLQRKNPQSYYGFPKGQQVFFTCASIDADGATDLLNKMRSKLMNCAPMKDKIVGDSVDYLTMQTDNDVQVYGKRRGVPTIKINTGACSSNGLRGKNNIMVILDQVAFFSTTQSSKFSGTEIYNALTPSCASFKRKGAQADEKGDGLVFLISSPNKQQGIFWQTYQNSFRMVDDILMFQMNTSMVNPFVDSNYLKLQYKKNPQTFDVEYNANFSTKSLKFIGDKQQLYKCVDEQRTANPSGGIQGHDYFMAIDLAYKNDATAIAIVHKQKDVYIVDYVNAMFPGSSDIWEIPNSIYKQYNEFADMETLSINLIHQVIKDLCKRFPIKKGTYDQWSGGFALQQLLYEQGLQRIQMNSYGPVVNSITWDLFETLMRDQKISFWNCKPLLQQLCTLQYQVVRNNRKVFAPKQQGFHDDLSDAVARAIHLCYNSTQRVTKKVTTGVGFGSQRGVVQSAVSYNMNKWNKIKQHGGVQSRDVAYQNYLRRGMR